MIVELEPDGPVRAGRSLLLAILAAASLVASLASGAPRSAWTLALPDGEGDVQLAAIPERLVNDPQPPHTVVTRVRRTIGIAADADGAVTLSWSERGYYYRLSSSTLGIAELARVAARLR